MYVCLYVYIFIFIYSSLIGWIAVVSYKLFFRKCPAAVDERIEEIMKQLEDIIIRMSGFKPLSSNDTITLNQLSSELENEPYSIFIYYIHNLYKLICMLRIKHYAVV